MREVTLDDYKAEERMMAKTEARTGLRIHIAATVIVCIVLVAVNVFVASEFPWALFPVLGMSIGVWFHWYFGVRHVEQFMAEHQETVEFGASRRRTAA